MEESVVNTPPVPPPPVSAPVVSYAVSSSDSVPDEIKGWSWGGFLWTWIWAIGNSTWIGLLALIPFLSLIMAIVLGVKGREWAWKNKHWASVEDFKKTQRAWVKWWFIIILPITIIITILYTVMIIAIIANSSARTQSTTKLQQVQLEESVSP